MTAIECMVAAAAVCFVGTTAAGILSGEAWCIVAQVFSGVFGFGVAALNVMLPEAE